jgi:hypothetical protein
VLFSGVQTRVDEAIIEFRKVVFEEPRDQQHCTRLGSKCGYLPVEKCGLVVTKGKQRAERREAEQLQDLLSSVEFKMKTDAIDPHNLNPRKPSQGVVAQVRNAQCLLHIWCIPDCSSHLQSKDRTFRATERTKQVADGASHVFYLPSMGSSRFAFHRPLPMHHRQFHLKCALWGLKIRIENERDQSDAEECKLYSPMLG